MFFPKMGTPVKPNRPYKINQSSNRQDRGLEYTWRGAVIGGDLDRINEFLENGQDIEERTGLDFWCFLFVKLRLGFENGALTASWKNAGDSSSIG